MEAICLICSELKFHETWRFYYLFSYSYLNIYLTIVRCISFQEYSVSLFPFQPNICYVYHYTYVRKKTIT